MKPEDWTPGTVDAIATGSADGKRLVIKAVNYENKRNIVFARLQGTGIPKNAMVKVYALEAALNDAPSMESADKIHVHEKVIPYTRELTIELEAYSVVVVEIMAN